MQLGCGGGGAPVQPEPSRYTLTVAVTNGSGSVLPNVALLLGLSPATTGADGTYSFDNLLPGSYMLSLQDGSENFVSTSATMGEQDQQLDIQLPATGGEFQATGVEPPLNSVGASLNGPFNITFSSAVNPASVSATSFSFTPDPGDFNVDVNGAQVTLTPLRQLPTNQVYLVQSTTSIASTGGEHLANAVRWRFRTSQTDNVPPVLVSTNPVNGKKNHPPNLGLVFEFNEPLAKPDAEFSVTVTPNTNVSASSSGSALFIQPEGQWEKQTEYTVSVSGVADVAGNRDTASAHTITFTTGSTPAPSNNVEPEWNQVLNRIVFASNRFGSYDIYSVAPDGSDLSRLTDLPGDERHPSVSADGTLLAFQYRTGGGKWNIDVQNIDFASEPREVTTDQFNDTQPVFSRTLTNEIFFVSERSDPAGIYQMNSDGSNLLELDSAFGSAQYDPAPHPLLNTQLLFSAYRSGTRDIWRKSISAIDQSVVNLNLTNDVLAEEHSPAWGPDASYIVYISDEDGVDNLWTADAGGDFPRQVTGFTTAASNPSVSPIQGEDLCVLSLASPGGGSELVIVDLVSGDIVARPTQPEAGN